MPPTLRSIAMSLSLRIISRLLLVDEALFNPSKASPPLMLPSPMTATTWRSFSPFLAAATAIPKAAEMEFEACPQYAFEFAVGAESLATSGEHFVPVSLMPHIPYNAVVWSVVDVMQRNGQFNSAQACGKVSRIARKFLNDVLS